MMVDVIDVAPADGSIGPDAIWQMKQEGPPVVGGQPRTTIYPRKIPEPNVQFTHEELYEEHSNEEGMYDCSLIPPYEKPIKPILQKK